MSQNSRSHQDRQRRRLTATEVDFERPQQRALLIGTTYTTGSVEEAEISLDELAHKHIRELPAPTRNTLAGLGALDTARGAAGSAASLASYLLFEPGFVNALIELGEHDAWRRKEELMGFFGTPEDLASRAAVP